MAKTAQAERDGQTLLEREREVERLESLIAGVQGGTGQIVLVEGPAGIGKTRLLAEAQSRAARRGLEVLSARGSALERDFPFGVVRQLFESLLAKLPRRRRERLLGGAAALAGPLLGLSPEAPGLPGPTDPTAVMHALYWLAANLAGTGPLLVAVDDAHWADGVSLRWCAYLAHRVADLQLGLLVALRSEEGDERPELRALRSDDAASRIMPEPLSRAATSQMVTAHVGSPDSEFVDACHSATGGNPFLLRELLIALADDAVAPVAAEAGRVGGLNPEAISRSVLARLESQPADARALAAAVALVGGPTDLRNAARLAELSIDDAANAADSLVNAGILTGPPLDFVHPLVRNAVYAVVPPTERRLAHYRASQLLSAAGADPREIAAQLLVAEPMADSEAVEQLRRAAARAMADGAPDTAGAYLRRALQEPPPHDVRPVVLAELGRVEALARDPRSVEHLRAALDAAPDPAARAAVAVPLGELLMFSGQVEEARALVDPVIDELADTDLALAARLEAARAQWGAIDRRLAAQVEARVPRLRDLAERAGPAGRELLLWLAYRNVLRGEHLAEVPSLVERGLDDGWLLHQETPNFATIVQAHEALLFADETERADALLEEVLAEVTRRGWPFGYIAVLTSRARSAHLRGDVVAAEEDARAALSLSAEHEHDVASVFCISIRAQALLELGRARQGARLLSSASIERVAGTSAGATFQTARGRFRVATGQVEDGLQDLRSAGEVLEGMLVLNPALDPWRSDLAVGLGRGDYDEARELIEVELDRARRAGLPRAIGVALAAQSRITEGEESIGLLSEAAELLAACPARLDQARVLTDLGAALRRARHARDAREPLRLAVELAFECGSKRLLSRAREELLATGARPRRVVRSGVDALTPTERRIALMALKGLSNPEIAQALFVSRKTVEMHLSNAYQKLEIHSREELPRVMRANPKLPGASP